ncbi:MAG TPA: hypothetical protein VLZ54_03345, partial [Arenibacter sp.]|nr:hypothetical protein [Arenibacter sp.]
FGPDTPYNGTVEVREGSVTGKLIGAGIIDHFNKKDGIKKEMQIDIRPTIDHGAIYLVFKNEGDKEDVIANLDWMSLQY